MLAVPKFSFPPLYPQKRSQNCGVLGSIVASCFGNFGILGKVRTEEEKKKKERKKKKEGWWVVWEEEVAVWGFRRKVKGKERRVL